MTGTGLHVDGRVVRAVRLTGAAPATVAETELPAADDRATFVDACIRIAARVGAVPAEPLRLTWSEGRLEALEVNPTTAAALAAAVRELADRGCTALASVTAPNCTIAVGVVWNHDAADAMAADLRAAGFTDVTVEPAGLSIRRVAERPASAAAVRPEHAAAYGAALAATGRPGRVGPLRRLDLGAVVRPARSPWVVERLPAPAAATESVPGPRARLRAALGRLRSTRCAS